MKLSKENEESPTSDPGQILEEEEKRKRKRKRRRKKKRKRKRGSGQK